MTSKLTRDELNEVVSTYGKSHIAHRMAVELLAAMDSEPVAYTDERNLGYIDRGRDTAYLWGKQNSEASDVALYRHAQPASVVMDDKKLRELFDAWFASDCSFDQSPEASEADNIAWRESYWYVWQRCRAAMLQELQKSAGAEATCRSNKNVQDLQVDNSPAIPDGYVMVPVEPNGDMLAAAQDAYGETDGDIASTLRAAMLAAAPQEVKGE